MDNVIIKPALETGQGHGVFCFHQDNLIVSPEQYLHSLGDNFIIQERVKQHAEVAKLNPSSLNTFRVVTYRERDNVYILNVTLKIGHKGEIVDNGHAGGYFVGTNKDGTLKKWVYSLNPFSKKEMTESGIKVDGLPVPSFHKLKETVCELSLLLPYHRIVGWDMAIDENGNPLLVGKQSKNGY
ncbi:sugar-transfer associated ATP-grasp domain-containing protein [Bacteroides uniformis]|uniref:sugar-transfer associated ATP-grasp domain-containing protein n=1 Tax=Bacteroides uniformis TaxID=820 RepID=UPI00189A10A4|nr:sugar-transfer associated ATP-grasp domain-containing protein [Bacteroides uniformis]MDC1998287.1 sugar-transfer associated ATP-grasp domain-containing protein [Bacteroides uniformis]MDC2002051.1 sugar-transfer associated ATP-grasp domain-containing protein [Bacteroides uniformis]MDC2005990.1 sugar-transfer associated ATP-grasp domain-containing protein [Bacteroides uniformis]